jgi:hypothetical protein
MSTPYTRAELRALGQMLVNAAVQSELRRGFRRPDPCVTEKAMAAKRRRKREAKRGDR